MKKIRMAFVISVKFNKSIGNTRDNCCLTNGSLSCTGTQYFYRKWVMNLHMQMWKERKPNQW